MVKVLYDFNIFNKKGNNAMQTYHKKVTPALIKEIKQLTSDVVKDFVYYKVTFQEKELNCFYEISREKQELKIRKEDIKWKN